MRKLLAFFAMVFTIFAVVFFTLPSIQNPTLGIEFSGGYEVVYEVSEKDGSESKPEDSAIADVIAQRIDIAGVKNPQVDVEKTPDGQKSYIRVTVSSKNTTELAEILTLIESDTDITFTDSEGNFLMKGSDVLKDENGAILSYENGQPIVELNIKDTTAFGNATEQCVGKNMIAWIGYQEASDTYAGDFAIYSGQVDATEEEMAAVAKKIIVNATVNEKLTGEKASITGSFTTSEANQISKLLSAGNMEFVLTRTDVVKVDGAYGTNAFQKSLVAGVVGLLAIIVMMILIYKVPGAIASITLLLYTAVILGTFDLLGGEYGPDTIAAIVIGLGMAVDACIILFERLADELYKGRSLKSAYEESTKKSLSSILDSNITTIIAACALYFFGKRAVKGFATMLLITTVFNVVIMLLVTRLLMFLFIKSGKFDNKKYLFGVDDKKIPNINKGEVQTYFGRFNNVNFVKNSKKAFIGLICVIILGLGFAGGHAIYGAASDSNDSFLNFGLDFKDGATATINFTNLEQLEKDISDSMELIQSENGKETIESRYTVESINKYFNENIFTGSNVPSDTKISFDYDDSTDSSSLYIQFIFDGIDSEDASFLSSFDTEVIAQMNLDSLEYYDDYITISQQVTSPTMAKATVINALLSLLVAFALIVLYISIRFRYTYAIASIVALFVDTLVMFSIFAIFRIEVQVEFISAILAIIGYSINDTVVIFDRIREISKETNFGNIDSEGRYNIVNKALQNCASRSFWTTISTILPVVALIFVGADATLAFSIAMLVGLVSGIFTSLFVAPSLWLVLEKRHMYRLKEKAIKVAKQKDKKPRNSSPEEMTIVGIND